MIDNVIDKAGCKLGLGHHRPVNHRVAGHQAGAVRVTVEDTAAVAAGHRIGDDPVTSLAGQLGTGIVLEI